MEQKRRKLTLKQAKESLERRLVRSPVDGVVTDRMLSPGEFVAQISVIDKVFDAASGTCGVRMELANDGFLLSAGLPGRVKF